MEDNSRSILAHLFKKKDFLKSIKHDFTKDEINDLLKYSQNINEEYPEAMDRFYEWIDAELMNPDVNVLTIGWDSNGWGPGGNGYCRFNSRYGLVKMESSDYTDDHIEIFDKKTFFPWCIENLMNDMVDLDSDVFDEIELLALAKKLEMYENTILTINGKDIIR